MQTNKRSPCPVACTLDIVGDKWTLLIIRDMIFGRTTFKEFSQSPERIATNILSDRLAKLVQWGLADKVPSDEFPGRDVYQLTKKGKSLKPVLMAMVKWGLENVDGSAQLLKQI